MLFLKILCPNLLIKVSSKKDFGIFEKNKAGKTRFKENIFIKNLYYRMV
ncbi:MAG: hypothetical protein ACWA6U_00650 [Breznakibacter sp.]